MIDKFIYIQLTFGEKRQTIVTLADRLMVTDIVVILSGV